MTKTLNIAHLQNVSAFYRRCYRPVRGLLYYQHSHDEGKVYVEAYDIDPVSGKPINQHPLNVEEAQAMSDALKRQPRATGKKSKVDLDQQLFLHTKGLLPTNVLFIKPALKQEEVIWHTPAQERSLLFAKGLEIPDGLAHVPAMIWKASRRSLTIYALNSDERPTEKTKLFQAPFFNVGPTGHVCMGNVDTKIPESASLEEFMVSWESFFFNSYFTHANGAVLGKTNILLLWKSLIGTPTPFPIDQLLPVRDTITDLLK